MCEDFTVIMKSRYVRRFWLISPQRTVPRGAVNCATKKISVIAFAVSGRGVAAAVSGVGVVVRGACLGLARDYGGGFCGFLAECRHSWG
jgi:hypothetical protein